MSYKTIREWPESERPRERLLSHGPSALSDAQLIAILLRTGGSGRSAVDLGMEILQRFESLQRLEEASVAELSSIRGLGKAKIAQIKAAIELARRIPCNTLEQGPAFTAGKDVHAYFSPLLGSLRKEVFCCALLDAKNRLLRTGRVSEGTLTSSLVHPREAFRDAVREAAAAVIFVHNHPSGDPAPSREDITITERLAAAGEMIGIPVLDHVIVTRNGYTSMLEQGHLRAR